MELVRSCDGTLRVRKVSKGARRAGPWAASTLRREVEYLKSLGAGVTDCFPELLCAWDDGSGLGYEMSYVPDAIDAGKLASGHRLDQAQADALQRKLAKVLFDKVHKPVCPVHRLSVHVREVMDDTFAWLGRHGEFARLIDAPTVRVNGRRLAGARSAMKRIAESGDQLAGLDGQPQVRLHGDIFLENVLVPEEVSCDGWPLSLILIDPVSVAGVFEGHPLFDLVKYESYGTGELPALRSGKVEVDGFEEPSEGRYSYGVAWEAPEIRPFRRIDWVSVFRSEFVARYGPAYMPGYRLLEAYFAFVMARCTHGVQRRGRLLKGLLALNASIGSGDEACHGNRAVDGTAQGL